MEPREEDLTIGKLYHYCEPLLKAKTPEERKAGWKNLCPELSEEDLALLMSLEKKE